MRLPKVDLMKKARKVVLVTGTPGVLGRAVAEHFSKTPDTAVYSVSRRHIEGLENVSAIAADLLIPVKDATFTELLMPLRHAQKMIGHGALNSLLLESQ